MRAGAVHRKGAMRARTGEAGVLPGSMGTPSYHVEGRGEVGALCSSAHGAGRLMSRSAARRHVKLKDVSQPDARRLVRLSSRRRSARRSPVRLQGHPRRPSSSTRPRQGHADLATGAQLQGSVTVLEPFQVDVSAAVRRVGVARVPRLVCRGPTPREGGTKGGTMSKAHCSPSGSLTPRVAARPLRGRREGILAARRAPPLRSSVSVTPWDSPKGNRAVMKRYEDAFAAAAARAVGIDEAEVRIHLKTPSPAARQSRCRAFRSRRG